MSKRQNTQCGHPAYDFVEIDGIPFCRTCLWYAVLAQKLDSWMLVEFRGSDDPSIICAGGDWYSPDAYRCFVKRYTIDIFCDGIPEIQELLKGNEAFRVLFVGIRIFQQNRSLSCSDVPDAYLEYGGYETVTEDFVIPIEFTEDWDKSTENRTRKVKEI